VVHWPQEAVMSEVETHTHGRGWVHLWGDTAHVYANQRLVAELTGDDHDELVARAFAIIDAESRLRGLEDRQRRWLARVGASNSRQAEPMAPESEHEQIARSLAALGLVEWCGGRWSLTADGGAVADQAGI